MRLLPLIGQQAEGSLLLPVDLLQLEQVRKTTAVVVRRIAEMRDETVADFLHFLTLFASCALFHQFVALS